MFGLSNVTLRLHDFPNSSHNYNVYIPLVFKSVNHMIMHPFEGKLSNNYLSQENVTKYAINEKLKMPK